MDADSQQETVRFHRAITGPSNDTYGLIATDSKAQTVAEAASMFTRRLCASPPHFDFSRKSGKRMLWESELAVALLFGQRGIAEKGTAGSWGEPGVPGTSRSLSTTEPPFH
jgi:hypothetical protein